MSRHRRALPDVIPDLLRAARDPGLSSDDSEALVCLLVKERCLYLDARRAVVEGRSRCGHQGPQNLEGLVLLLHWQPAKPVTVHPPYAWDGSPTNVTRLYTRLTGGAVGERAARVLGQTTLRQEVTRAAHMYLYRAVSHKQVANVNDPTLTESPAWVRTLQSAWVRETLAEKSRPAE